MYVVQRENLTFQRKKEDTTSIKVRMKKTLCNCTPASLMFHYVASSIVEETNFDKAPTIFQFTVLKACILLLLFQISMIRLLAKILERQLITLRFEMNKKLGFKLLSIYKYSDSAISL